MKKGIEIFEEMNANNNTLNCIGDNFRKHTVKHDAGWIEFAVKFQCGRGIECIDKKDRDTLCEYLIKEGKKQTESTSLGFEEQF